jgi:hypothetical protein
MTPEQLLREAVEVLKWIDVWGREANGDGRYYVIAFDSPAGIQLRHVVANARHEATHADWNQPVADSADLRVPRTVNGEARDQTSACRVCGAAQSAHCDLDEPGRDHSSDCDLMHHEFKSGVGHE